MTYDEWKTAAVKKLRYPKAEHVAERHWKNAYMRNRTPDQAATEIDAQWYNGLSPAARKRLNKTGGL